MGDVDRSNPGRRSSHWLTAACAVALSLACYATDVLTPVERGLTDLRFRILSHPASDTLAIVEIDPKSLRALDIWPWARTHHAGLVEQLVAAGASQIALDIDFSSRSSEDADKILAQALAGAGGRVILPVFGQLEERGNGTVDVVYTAPLSMFRRQVRIASVNTAPGSDGLIREYAVLQPWEHGTVESLAALLAAPARPQYGIFEIDYSIRPDSIPRIPYIDILRGDFDKGLVAGRKVIVGATAVELGDQFSTPVYKVLPGPVLQALAYESIVLGRMLNRPAGWLITLMVIATGLAVVPLFDGVSWRRSLLALAGVCGGLFGLSIAVQAWTPLLLETTPMLLVAVLQFVASLGLRLDRLDTALVRHSLRLRRSSAFMRSVVQHSSEGIMTVTGDYIVDFANPAAGDIFATEPDALVGRRLETLLGDGELRTVEAVLKSSIGRPREVMGRSGEAESVPLEVISNEMHVDGQFRYVVLVRDVSERRAQEKLLEYLALHDTLTGLPNRALLLDRLEHEVARAEREGTRVALLLLDLDRFKQINDTLGHGVGDQLLAEFGQALSGALRRIDTVARLGGDEFAVVAPSLMEAEQARQVADRIAAALHRPFQIGDLSLDIGVSIGIAIYPDHGRESNDLMRGADVAMYEAKRDRRTIAVYDAESDQNSVRSLSMGGELRNAVREQELMLMYQPQIDLVDGHPVGAEALIRWDHPRYGFVSPGEFIPLAEQSGTIRPLTRWILGEAVRRLAEWQHVGLDLGVSVNLSPRNLHEEDLPEVVSRLLDTYGVWPGKLTLELTENAIMTNPERSLTAIRQLKKCGIRLAIDDFGTGYSSLSYLRSLPVDELKIDKSFVIAMTEEGGDEVIVRSTIDLAHTLGLSVVAEGVEAAEHLAVLRRLGCDVAQGYHIARPLGADALRQWLETADYPSEIRHGSAPKLVTRSTRG